MRSSNQDTPRCLVSFRRNETFDSKAFPSTLPPTHNKLPFLLVLLLTSGLRIH